MVQPDSGSVLPLSSLVLHNIAQGIFETIVEQAPLAIEELMNELEEEELSEEEEELLEEEAQERGMLSREPPKGEDCTLHGDSLRWTLTFLSCPTPSLLPSPLKSVLSVAAGLTLETNRCAVRSPSAHSVSPASSQLPRLCSCHRVSSPPL